MDFSWLYLSFLNGFAVSMNFRFEIFGFQGALRVISSGVILIDWLTSGHTSFFGSSMLGRRTREDQNNHLEVWNPLASCRFPPKNHTITTCESRKSRQHQTTP